MPNKELDLEVKVPLPVSFLIGGIAAVAIGGVTDEGNEGDRQNCNGSLFANSALRAIVHPIRIAATFCAGGCMYLGYEHIGINILGRRCPLIPGAVIGFCFANGLDRARTSVCLGSILGTALFAQVTDNILLWILKMMLTHGHVTARASVQ